ncbi:MAG TPA: hypothetical protein VER26_07760 [Xanthobacteraceae bacterium]|nr:hypothetical protein [Xanthobacteraceae bacterium]
MPESAAIDIADQRVERPVFRPGRANARRQARHSGEAAQHDAAGKSRGVSLTH